MKKLLLLLCPLFLFCGYVNAKQPKLAESVWFLMERQTNMDKQPYDSVIVSYQITNGTLNNYNMPRPIITITIRNKSERTLYVDKQKSFIIPNEELLPLFTNSTKVSTQGSTTMGGVNLGVIGVGGASSDFNSTIVQEQRFLTIPAESKIVLEYVVVKYWGSPWKLNNNAGRIRTFSDPTEKAYDRYFIILDQNFINKDEVLSYNDEETPLNLDFRICYSFSEDMKPSFINRAVYYTKHAIGSERNKTKQEDYILAKKLFPSLDSYQSDKNVLVLRLWKGYNWMN